MKLSKTTMAILSNFTKVNQSIIVDEPNCIKSTNNAANLIAVYDTEEQFPEFALYNLNEFMSLLSMFDQDKMDIDFKEKTAVIKAEGEKSKQAVSYNFSNKEVLNCKTKNSSNYKKQLNAEASFCISKDDLKKLVKSAAIMGLHHLNIKATDGEIVLTLLNKNDDTGNKYSLTMEGQGSCNIIISVDSLIFLDGDYAIEVKDGACIRATHAQLPLFYIVTAHKV